MSINRRIDKIKSVLNEKHLTDVAYPVFVKNTPVRSGNARRKTSKDSNSINANYPYATRLENGYSKQAPDGMAKPTREFLLSYIKKALT